MSGPKVARLLRQLADEQSSNGQPLGNRECNDVPWLTGEKASH